MARTRIINGIIFTEYRPGYMVTVGDHGGKFEIRQSVFDHTYTGTVSGGTALVGTAVSNRYFEIADVVQWGRSAVGTLEQFPAERAHISLEVSEMIGVACQAERESGLYEESEINAATDMAYDIAAQFGFDDASDQSIVSIMELIALRWPHVANHIFRRV